MEKVRQRPGIARYVQVGLPGNTIEPLHLKLVKVCFSEYQIYVQIRPVNQDKQIPTITVKWQIWKALSKNFRIITF